MGISKNNIILASDVTTSLESTSSMIPDYSSGVSIPNDTTFTAPSNGIIITSGSTYRYGPESTFYINDIMYKNSQTDSANPGATVTFPLAMGDTFKVTWSQDMYRCDFYPLK